ncbi:MFS transporter [bacterium]|nr:MFS transporter [bacterium]
MIHKWLGKITGVRDDEIGVALLSCAYFFCVLCGYYILRPLREEMGLAGGVDALPRLYLVNLGVMLVAAPVFGWLVNRFKRRAFIPVVYRFFMMNMLIFFALTKMMSGAAEITLGRVFYVWVSVYNMWAVSLFWAYMADGFDLERSKRLFGFIAMGGTVGAIIGAAITAGLVDTLGRVNLILISIVLLELAVRCVNALGRRFAAGAARPDWHEAEATARGGFLNGVTTTLRSPYLLGISAYLFLYSLSSTFLYFEQAHIIGAAVAERAARAALFARIDLWVNLLTLALQIVVAGRLIPRIGVGITLTLLPILTVVGFLVLGWAPVLVVLVIFQVVRRAGNYALIRPARETLYTIVPLDQKYKAKSFIDTFVYRGGDALGAGVFDALIRAGLGLAGIAFTAAPIAAVWGVVGLFLGTAQQRLAAKTRR